VLTHGPVRSLAEAAVARGVEPADVVKTLVVRRDDDSYVLVLIPGDRALAWPKLRSVLGVARASLPDAAEARAATGFERGTITPFGTVRGWPVLADERLLGRRITLGAGVHGVAVALSADEALAALGATVTDLSRPEEDPGQARPSHPVAGSVVVRSVGPADWAIWRALRQAALADAPAAFSSRLADWVGAGDRPARWQALLARPGGHFVAERAGSPVGLVAGLPVDDVPDAVALVSLWVTPAARGAGVGEALVDAVRAWAVAHGAGRAVLAVAAGQDATARWYGSLGFRPAPEDAAAPIVGAGCEQVLAFDVERRP
jgi:prolyl-tRNA editing enzyme YbaK/EbsC (Cys-tRNA(Pro) deacylase)/GNAT superfamily N-acetyltransferase